MSNETPTPPAGASPSGTEDGKRFFSRRDIIQGLATLPVVGVFIAKLAKKRAYDANRKDQIMAELGVDGEPPAIKTTNSGTSSSREIRLGIIGCGSRGEYLLRAAGFAHPSWVDEMKLATADDPMDKRLEDFLKQDDLHIVINGVCDPFDIRADAALVTVSKGSNMGSENTAARRFRTYQEMLDSPDIDAVIVATPEHWHAQMAIDAAQAGKHLYLEKPLTRTIPEVKPVADAIRSSGIVFQLGHQGRQTDAYMMAREIVDKGILGKISLVEVTTNRNDPNGAWLYTIPPDASPMNIDWRQFTGPAQRRPFSLERFFRWRLWYDYGSGLSGDLFTHEYDALNMILGLGIPKTAMATGGVYYYKDGREVPDVYHAVYEYPDRDLTVMYSATLASNTKRGKQIMGDDANMDLGQLHASALSVTADMNSKRYQKKIESGIINTELPMFSYTPGSKGLDAVTSATEKYFAGRGLLYTYRDGKRVDTTHLHIKEWLDAIRDGGTPSCGIEQGIQEAVTAHMGTLSYLAGTKVEWDPVEQKIVGMDNIEDYL